MAYVNWENREDFWEFLDKVDGRRKEHERIVKQNQLVNSEFEDAINGKYSVA